MNRSKILTRLQVNFIIKKYRIRIDHFTIRKNGIIDVNGDVHISNTQLKRLPLVFGKVTGNFYCSSNRLTSLEGCPAFVGGIFNCYGNELKTLKGGPGDVGADYFCHENRLESLIGAPKEINGNFNCFINKLTALSSGPKKVLGSYYANNNLLRNLKGAPHYVGKSFYITSNYINNLEDCPREIGETIAVDNTVKLYFGNESCNVRNVEIEIKKMKHELYIPELVFNYKKHLPILFKYGKYLNLYHIDGRFNTEVFYDLIYDVKGGLR